MLGRVGTFFVKGSRNERFRRTAFSVSALSVTGLAAFGQIDGSRTTEKALSNSNDSVSIAVPTLEASLRACRLFRTAVLIYLDYTGFDAAGIRIANAEHKDPDKWRQLEEDLEKRRQELELAQIAYTSPSDKDADSRKKLKQRDGVHAAAQNLAEAKDRLAQYGDRKSIVHRKAANRLLKLCRDNGGVYIKIGQHLANLDYLIPNEYIEVLGSLFDDAPTSEYSDVRQVIKEDLGKYPEELWDSFEAEPIASASLAQVHTAIDRETGKKLAVKIQHRGLRETSVGDLFALTTVVRTVESLFEDFTWGWIADEIAPQLPKELDFCIEGRNAETASDHIQTLGLDCIVPKVVWDQTSARVLCMEFEEGFKATDIDAMKEAGLQKRDVAKLVSSVFSAQAFLTGFVHCDPHPANVLIREKKGKPQMVLVDHGLYKKIDDDFRIRYAYLWRSLMMADLQGIKKSCESLGVREMHTLLAAMLTSRPFDEIFERSKTGALASVARPESEADKAMIQGYAQQYFQEIIEILDTLPRQMLLLLKMNDCLRHIDYTLESPTNTLVIAGNYAARALYENQVQDREIARRDRFKSWFDYVKLIVRIRVYDFGVWLANRST